MEELKQTGNNAHKNLRLLYQVLQPVSMVLIIAGFAGPWLYGPLGKSSDFGWQPVWAILLYFFSLNLFILLSAIHCFSYLELFIRSSLPVLKGVLQWVGTFLVLIIIVPLATWLPFDQTQRNPRPQYSENTIGWGLWLALVGLVLQVIAFRVRIWVAKRNARAA